MTKRNARLSLQPKQQLAEKLSSQADDLLCPPRLRRSDSHYDRADQQWSRQNSFTAAIYSAAWYGTTVSGFIANSTDALALAQIKALCGGTPPLLQPDPTQPGRSLIGGVPLYVSPGVQTGTVWAIPAGRCYVVIREDATVTVDSSVYFSSDRSAVRAIMRAGFAFPHAAAIGRITKA